MKKKRNKKRKSSKKYEKPIDSYLKKQIPYLEKYEFGGIGGGQMNQQIFDASSAALMATTTDAVAGMLGTVMGNSNVPKVFDYSPNQNPIMAKGGIVEGDPPYKKVGNYQTSFHPKDMAYFERMQKRFPEAYEASKSQYLLPGMHEVGTESVYKDDSYNPNTKEDNIDYETKYIIKSGGRSIPRTANQQGMHNFDIKDDQIMMPRLSALDKRLYKKSLRQYAKGTGMQGVQNDPPPRKSLGKYTARVSPQDQKFYDKIQKKATPEAWQAIQGQFMTPGEYDLGMEDDIYRGYKYNPNTKEDNVTTKSKYFATSGNYEYPHTVIDDVKGLSNYNVTEDGYLDVAPLSRKGKESDIRKIRKMMRKYAKGGVVQAPVAEVEDGEVYEKPNGEVGVFVGDKHGQDTDGDGFEGIPVTEQEVPKDTKIFSAQLGMAKKKLDREKEKKKQQEDLKENPTVFERNTYKRGEEIRAMQQKADEQIQEAANMLDQGQQMANDLAIVKQKYGGLIKYANGGSTGNNMFNTLLGMGNNIFGGAAMGGYGATPKTSENEVPSNTMDRQMGEKDYFTKKFGNSDFSIPTTFGKGGMIPKYQHGGMHGDPPPEEDPYYQHMQDLYRRGASVYNTGDINLNQLPTNETAPIVQRNIPFNQVLFPGAKNPYLDLSGIQGTTDVKPAYLDLSGVKGTTDVKPVTETYPKEYYTGPIKPEDEDVTKTIQFNKDKITDESDTSGYNFTMGDMMGFAGTGIGGTAPMLTTLINRATDTPNINPYLNYGKAGLAELEKMKGAFGTIRDENLRDIGLKSDTQRKRARSSARSVNTLRAFEDLANAREQELTSDIYTKYAGQMAGISGSIAKAMDARDSMTMQGRAKQDEADRMDRDNFFTQLNQDFGSMGEAMQKIGKDLNVKQLDKDFLDVLTSTNKYGIGYRYNQSGKFEMFSKNTGKSLTPKEQKKYLAGLKKEMDEKNKAVWSANKEAKKQAKKQNLPVTDMGYQSLLLGNQTGVNTNPLSMGINPNFQQYTKIKK